MGPSTRARRHQLRIRPTDLLVRSPRPRPRSLPAPHAAVPIGARPHHPIGAFPLPPGDPSLSKWAPRRHASMVFPRPKILSLSLALRSSVPNPNPYKPSPLAMSPGIHPLLSRPVRTRLRALLHGSPSAAPDPHRGGDFLALPINPPNRQRTRFSRPLLMTRFHQSLLLLKLPWSQVYQP